MNPKQRFVILARYFLDGLNPKPRNEIVFLDCILAFPDHLLEFTNHDSLRHFAHTFVRQNLEMINHDLDAYKASMDGLNSNIWRPIQEWLLKWWIANT